ncbi:MAG: Rieske (2Fe-2S) protein [Nitrospira sp.]|nr:Rieske (2Fe-2S) protein [Nitrospira sp.]MDE0403772.1 Rieske (2Fe-2S) protein [Nitrospira sp.]MDE0486453.1 Rieske (2Fe-2S) protein [Nitrospira sp.]
MPKQQHPHPWLATETRTLVRFLLFSQKFTVMQYFDVAKLEDLEPGTCLSVELDDTHGVALFNVDGEILALDNTCPHAGGPLGEGTLNGEIVECPWHGWEFNVRTGQCIENPNPEWAVPCYRTRVENGVIQVAFPPETA